MAPPLNHPSADSCLSGPESDQNLAVISNPVSPVAESFEPPPRVFEGPADLTMQAGFSPAESMSPTRPVVGDGGLPPSSQSSAATPNDSIPAAATNPSTNIYIGNVPLTTGSNSTDKIATAFHNSSRKTLSFIPPTLQNGEVIVRPSLNVIRDGSHGGPPLSWLVFGKKTVFSSLERLCSVCLAEGTRGYGYFQWLLLLPVQNDNRYGGAYTGTMWIKLRHLPVELWTNEGLSIVASGIGRPLYPDAITRACTRLDFARVCIMLDISSKLPKHIVIMVPQEDGGEPYDEAKAATDLGLCSETGDDEPVLQKRFWNVRGLNRRDHQVSVNNLVAEHRLQFIGLLETRVSAVNVARVQRGMLPRWNCEVCGQSGDIRGAAEEFQECLRGTGLITLPMQGEWFTWHNCSRDSRSLWKRLDRLLVNDCWLGCWPNTYYVSLSARTSDHSPLVLRGDIPIQSRICQHRIVGTTMFAVTRKLKALKPVFRALRQKKVDLSNNVKLAASFLDAAQNLLAQDRTRFSYIWNSAAKWSFGWQQSLSNTCCISVLNLHG
ncbi:UNVERIFIED_CONTAM: hypothetical protein Slati_3079900 [Sesamum latifolium]|uniref:DUF4283 domain-containing protein n=1 Tax=Sesamum latifolium TaxID=2727402 RepID=A0AAW2UWE9_9LAMI